MINIDVAIPILNEEDSLEECIDSIIALKIPNHCEITIYLIDGGSKDNSVKIIEQYVKKYNNVFFIENKKKLASAAMNLVILKGKGDYILRLDAGNVYDEDYLVNCHKTSIKYNAANVGGIVETVAGSKAYGSKLVQAIMSHPFGVGNSKFRTGSKNEVRADTVPFGFFKKSIFREVGNFNENLLRAQDYELNSRIIKSGNEIWLNPMIKAKYFTLTFWKFIKKNLLLEGPYNAYMWYVSPHTFSIRHSITLFFTLGVIGGILFSHLSSIIFYIYISVLILYFLLSIYFSITLAISNNEVRHIFVLPFSFFCFHFLHGLGVLTGVINIIFRNTPFDK